MNGSLSARSAKLELYFVDVCSKWSHKEIHVVQLPPNQATELLSIPCAGPPKKGSSSPTLYSEWTTTFSVVVGARLLDCESGDVLARFADWPQPYRLIDLVDPGLKVSTHSDQGEENSVLYLEVKVPAKCVVLSVTGEGEDPKWSDNALDLMPGDKQFVTVHGLKGRSIQVSYLGKEKASDIQVSYLK